MTLNATTTTFLETLAIARDHHAHGRLREADKCYREAMAVETLGG